MFWAAEITPSKSHKHPETPLSPEEEETYSLHISNLSLVTTKKTPSAARYRVYAQVDDKKFVIANLKEGAIENHSLDLYYKQSEEVTFSMSGKGDASVHITGYFETSTADMGEDMYGMDPMGMEMNFEDEDEEIEMDPSTKQNIALAKTNALKNATMALEDDSEEDSEDIKEIIPKKAPAPKKAAAPKKEKKEKKAKKVKKPVVQEDSDESDNEDAPKAVPTPIVDDSDSEDAPVMNKKSIPFEDEDDSDSDSDGFNVKAILAQRKRKAAESAQKSEKKQKTSEKTEEKPKSEGNQGNNQKGKGGKKRNKKNKNKNKNKGKN